MAEIAKVLSDVALDREFDYRIPAYLSERVGVGSHVLVPFGHRKVRGFVVGLADETTSEYQLKDIIDVIGEKPLIRPQIIKLARWMADYYCAPVENAIRTVLPGAVRRKGAKHKEQLNVRLNDAVLADVKITEKQQAVLEALAKVPEKEMLLADLALAAGVTSAPVKALEKKGLVTIEKATIYRDPHAGVELLKTSAMDLMPEQKTSLDKITAALDAGGPQTVLLYGVTGSGKTEVYLQAIQHVLDKGQSSIVLVPEIALTPQTVDRFRSRFGEVVAVLHSSLSEGERHDEWARIRNGEAQIVIGARSALFAPIENIGLIVVDEEHEQTYKQDESPRYNARDVAVVRAHMEKCAVVLGSATPSLESYHNVMQGKYQMATMRNRVDDRQMPRINVIDMRLEAQREGKPSLFAKELLDQIGNRLHRTEQVMLFLNRRGFAASLICPECGYVTECDMCSVSMTYHKKDHRMGCHICGEEKPVPEKCPECGLLDFSKRGVGTERIEEVIGKCFPKARVFRMDSDTMRKKDAYRKVLADFRAAKIDILIGTQMIAKGLDFPNVTLVGVINADITLHMPDFRAGERTYQLLTQVAGRAGRGDLAGEVIIQTYTPHHQAIQAVRNLGYEQFADQELAFREELLYPPYSHLVCLTLKGLVENQVETCADHLAEALLNYLPPDVMLSGPAPAPLSRAKGYYRFQIMMRAPRTNQMTIPLRKALNDFKLPKNVKATFDVDAVSTM
ncbi:primosomal protein N' [Verrucomicrobiota bacterium]